VEPEDLIDELSPVLLKGEIGECIKRASEKLRELPENPFSEVLNLEFTNDLKEVANCFEQFIRNADNKFEINVLYTETNGFDINPDVWYFDIFGYVQHGGLDDLDWLADWQIESSGGFVLTGMESLQSVYSSDAFGNSEYEIACEYASLLVVLKFQKLFQKSLQAIGGLSINVLATSHDYDFIYEHVSSD